MCSILPAAAGSIELVRNGKPNATIVLAAQPSVSARLAALELQYHVEEMTGAVLPIQDDIVTVTGNRVLVGQSRATTALGIRSADFKPTEYLIKFRPATLILIGLDWVEGMTDPAKEPQSFEGRSTIDYNKGVGRRAERLPVVIPSYREEQGTCYAVYDLLERCCGVRWYGPNRLNVVIPGKKDTLVVKGRNIRRFPSIRHRQLSWNPWPTENEILYGQPEVHSEEMELFRKRMRDGGLRWYANHSALDGDWLKDEETGEALGYTDQRLVDKLVRAARDFFDGKGLPAFTRNANSHVFAMGDYFAIVPNDSNLVRVTEEDRRVYAISSRDERGQGHFGTAVDSYYFFQLLNRVAKELRKSHPDKKIATLAYKGYSYKPAGLDLESNIAVAPCTPSIGSFYETELSNDRRFYREWADWSKQTGADLFTWGYYCFPYEIGMMAKYNVFPIFLGERISTDVSQYVRDRVRGIFLCGGPLQPENYIYMRTAWDAANADYNRLLDEFFSSYFGRAGVPMKRFYQRVMGINRQETFNNGTLEASWKVFGTEARMRELGDCFSAAKELAETNEQKARVDLWTQAFRDRMVAGREMYTAWAAKKADRLDKVARYARAAEGAENVLIRDKAPHESIADRFIANIRVFAHSALTSPYALVNGKCMRESRKGVLGTKDARLDISKADGCWTGIGSDGVWVKLDLFRPFQLTEIRLWNHPDKKKAMERIRIEYSLTGRGEDWRVLQELEPDAAYAPDAPLVIPAEGVKARFIKLTSVGGGGSETGLGQVRLYGQPD